MSGGGDSGGGSTQIEPWDQSKGHLISAMNRADRFMNGGVGFNPLTSANGVQAFRDYVGFDPGMQGNAYGLDPGQLQTGAITGVNPLNADQRAAQGMMRTLAGSDSSGLTNSAAGAFQNASNVGNYVMGGLGGTANGAYLNGNPYLEGQYNAAARGLKDDFKTEVLPALAAQFSGGAGAHGSPDHQYWAGKAAGDLTDTLGDMRANLYGQNYQAERDRQQQAQQFLVGTGQAAAGQLPGIDQALYGRQLQNADLMGRVGDMDYNVANALLGQQQSRYTQADMAPWNRLNAYSDIIYGNPGSSMGSTTGPEMSGNRAGSAIGGAMSGAATGGMIGGPYGAAIGGGVGLLGGLLM